MLRVGIAAACLAVISLANDCQEGECDGNVMLQTDASSQGAQLYVLGFTPYYNYDGPLAVTGDLKVSFGWKNLQMSWSLDGADGNCLTSKAYPNGKVSNDCGIHIHVGMSCSEDAGGHYFLTSEDPWQALHYRVDQGSTNGKYGLNAGLTASDALGHSVIVHDLYGARIACGILMTEQTAKPYVLKSWVPYYNYVGALSVSGQIKIQTINVTQYLSWSDLKGADANCYTTPLPNGPASNDCGIHIHIGMNCFEDAGDHYHATPTDPWKAVRYVAYAKGPWKYSKSWGQAEVLTDLGATQILGHTVIVHDITGSRVACGIIEQ